MTEAVPCAYGLDLPLSAFLIWPSCASVSFSHFLPFNISCWYEVTGHFNIGFLMLQGGQEAFREKSTRQRKDRNKNENRSRLYTKIKIRAGVEQQRVTQCRVERTQEGWKAWLTVGPRSVFSRLAGGTCTFFFARWRRYIPAAPNPTYLQQRIVIRYTTCCCWRRDSLFPVGSWISYKAHRGSPKALPRAHPHPTQQLQ